MDIKGLREIVINQVLERVCLAPMECKGGKNGYMLWVEFNVDGETKVVNITTARGELKIYMNPTSAFRDAARAGVSYVTCVTHIFDEYKHVTYDGKTGVAK